jgi:hypothetical protein
MTTRTYIAAASIAVAATVSTIASVVRINTYDTSAYAQADLQPPAPPIPASIPADPVDPGLFAIQPPAAPLPAGVETIAETRAVPEVTIGEAQPAPGAALIPPPPPPLPDGEVYVPPMDITAGTIEIPAAPPLENSGQLLGDTQNPAPAPAQPYYNPGNDITQVAPPMYANNTVTQITYVPVYQQVPIFVETYPSVIFIERPYCPPVYRYPWWFINFQISLGNHGHGHDNHDPGHNGHGDNGHGGDGHGGDGHGGNDHPPRTGGVAGMPGPWTHPTGPSRAPSITGTPKPYGPTAGTKTGPRDTTVVATPNSPWKTTVIGTAKTPAVRMWSPRRQPPSRLPRCRSRRGCCRIRSRSTVAAPLPRIPRLPKTPPRRPTPEEALFPVAR